jgi:hypothetical protein
MSYLFIRLVNACGSKEGAPEAGRALWGHAST